jgi:hypothetical protein
MSLPERLVIFLSACIEGILQLFTNLYLHRKLSIFIRNDCDCKAIDLLNIRKRYAVMEGLDFRRNIPWLASCFSKIKKPNKNYFLETVYRKSKCEWRCLYFDTILAIYP